MCCVLLLCATSRVSRAPLCASARAHNAHNQLRALRFGLVDADSSPEDVDARSHTHTHTARPVLVHATLVLFAPNCSLVGVAAAAELGRNLNLALPKMSRTKRVGAINHIDARASLVSAAQTTQTTLIRRSMSARTSQIIAAGERRVRRARRSSL